MTPPVVLGEVFMVNGAWSSESLFPTSFLGCCREVEGGGVAVGGVELWTTMFGADAVVAGLGRVGCSLFCCRGTFDGTEFLRGLDTEGAGDFSLGETGQLGVDSPELFCTDPLRLLPAFAVS